MDRWVFQIQKWGSCNFFYTSPYLFKGILIFFEFKKYYSYTKLIKIKWQNQFLQAEKPHSVKEKVVKLLSLITNTIASQHTINKMQKDKNDIGG